MSALAFAAGVLATFLGLAGLLLALRAAGQSVGWGFQLQSPVFVSGMALLFVVIALNFAGLFEFGLSLTRLGQHDPVLAARAEAVGAGPMLGSFGSGALAVLVATPCTAPFMGSALGYTLGQPACAAPVVSRRSPPVWRCRTSCLGSCPGCCPGCLGRGAGWRACASSSPSPCLPPRPPRG